MARCARYHQRPILLFHVNEVTGIDGEKVGARDTALKVGDCVVLQVGKRKFVRVTLS